MDVPPDKSPSPAAAVPDALDPQSLRAEITGLRRLVAGLVFAILVLTASLFLFLFREVSLARRQSVELIRYITAYEKNTLPLVQDVRSKLQKFAQTNSEYRPLFNKYINPPNPAAVTNLAPPAPLLEK